MTHFLMSVSDSYLGHLHCVGQHLLQSADRQGLLQNKGAYGQVRGHILQTHIYSTGVKIAREKDNFINHQRGKKIASMLVTGIRLQRMIIRVLPEHWMWFQGSRDGSRNPHRTDKV